MTLLETVAQIDPTQFEGFRDRILESVGYFGPEFLVAAAALVIFIADLFLPLRASRHLAWLALAGCLIPLLSVADRYPETPELFLGMTAIDPFANFYKKFFLLGTVPVIVLSYLHHGFQGRRMGEFYGVLLASLLGAMLMASSTNFLMLFMALELLSISSYILVGFLRQDRRGAEAALKYIIYGSVAAGIMAYGFSLYFGLTGTADIGSLASVVWNRESEVWLASALDQRAAVAVTAAILLIFMGIAYKIATIPMHFWAPDVYEGAPTPITAFLSVISKAAGFALGLRILRTLTSTITGLPEGSMAGEHGLWDNVPWTEALAVVSIITMTLGNLAALWQTNLKRLLAYSSIAHAGYMMMGFTFLNAPEVGGLGAITYYLLAYLAMNYGAFAVVNLIENRLGSVDLDDYRGLGKRAPFLSLSLAVFLFSLIGVPPTAGFAGKWLLFMGVFDAARYDGAMAAPGWYYALALAAAVNTAVSAYYYLKIVREMYLADSKTAGRLRFPLLGELLVAVMVFLTFYLFLVATRGKGLLEEVTNLTF